MKYGFTYYDIIALIIPGFIFLAFCVFLYDGPGAEYIQKLANGGFAESLLAVISSYVAGEILQSYSKILIEKPVFHSICKGMPYVWVFNALKIKSTKAEKDKALKVCSPEDLKKLRYNPVISSLKSKSAFIHHIRFTASSVEHQLYELNKSLSQANMFRGLSLVSIIACYMYFISHFKDFSTPFKIEKLIPYTLFLTFFIISVYRYYTFTINYTKRAIAYYCK